MNPQDARRLVDLRAAKKRAKPTDLLALAELALLWGVSKARFVTVQGTMEGFPDPQPAPKEMGLPTHTHVYPARAAIDAMIAFVTRHEGRAKARADRTAAILGKDRADAQVESLHTPNELAVLNRLARESEEREREQRMYIPAAEVAAVAGDIFSLVSEFCETLPNKMDPHGELPPKQRDRLKAIAAEEQLLLYRKVKHLLAPDADAEGNRDSSHSARQPRARRKRGRSVSVAAG